jgi:hypothetical protein
MLITHNAINLERPSDKSRSIVEQNKKDLSNLTKHETNVLKKIKHQLNIDDDDENLIKKKRKKHGINPLSKKKKKNKDSINQLLIKKNLSKKKRRRTRQLRISPHLKQHLKELQKHFSIKQFFHIK